MGSSCSILNDTEYEVWVTDRINWPVLIGVSAGVAALLLSAGGIATFLVLGSVEAGVGGALGGGATAIATIYRDIFTVTAGAFRPPLGREVLNLSIKRLAKALNITERQAEDLQNYVREFQAEAKLIRPGEKYTWSGTLSLTRRVHVMNELLQFGDKACFTGPTDGSENVYRISEHFTRLDVRKRSSENTTMASSLPEEICPDATSVEIEAALSASGGDAKQAAQALLGVQHEEDDDDGDLVQMLDTGNNAPQPVDAMDALQRFRDEIIETSKPRQLFTVSRMEGIEELKLDVFVHYKSKTANLKAHPRVRFEQEEGAGSGPVREFLSIAMKIADEGMATSSKPVIFFEGEKDHRLPVHDHSLRLTGSFKAIGRIIGHCALHGGPALHGLSPAVKYYLSNPTVDLFESPPPLSVQDIPDIDLRQLITEIDSLGKDDRPPAELRASVGPYLLEAGLDIDKLISDPGLVTQGLILFNVLLKRKPQLDDIVKGMEEFGLGSALKKWPVLADAIFPEDSKRSIRAEEFNSKVAFEEREANAKTADYFLNYIELMESRKEDDGANLADLCRFWTGANTLPSGITEMLIKFDDNIELPIADTCVLSMTIPTKHHTFEEFCKYFDIAIKYGGQGFSFA